MSGLSGELYKQCRDTLLQCSEFDSNAALRAVFTTDELAPFSGGLPEANNKGERVDACLGFLLSKRLSDGRPVPPLFVEALRDRYHQGDALRDELDALAGAARNAMESPTSLAVEPPSKTAQPVQAAEESPRPPTVRGKEDPAPLTATSSPVSLTWLFVSVIAGVVLGLISNVLANLWDVDTPQHLLIVVGAFLVALVSVLWVEFAKANLAMASWRQFVTRTILIVGGIWLIGGIILEVALPPPAEPTPIPVPVTTEPTTPSPSPTTVPTATRTPSPTRSSTPSVALSPSAVVLSPLDGEQVSIRNEVRGQASNLWTDHQLWLLVQASEGSYYPQPGPIEVDSEGAWVASADVGSASQLEWERPYTVTMVIANPEASQEFSSFLKAWPVGWDKGLTLPEGCTVLDTARVIRTNPIVTLTSHESQAYVGSHETLKGTYRNMKPGDWLLYGVVELGYERFIPYGPFEPRADSGEWAIDVIFPWPADGSRDVFFHTLAVLTYTRADEILRSSVGSSLSTADLSANDWNVILGPVTQVKLTRAQRIAFASDKPGNDDIFIINVDGTGRLRLTDDAADDMDPAWSPDGTSVVFASTRDGPVQLFLVDSDGHHVRRLIPDRVVPGRAPTWSPDGEWIAFHSEQGGTTDIYRVRIAGTDLTRLTDDPETDWYPVWSPDGESILFYSERAEDDAGRGELYVMDADGEETSLTRLTENTYHESYAAWSPDGRHILFISEVNGKRDVYLMNADGSDAVLVADVDYDRHPTFAPDGQRFVFDSSANNGQLFLATLGGGKPEQIQTDLARSWWPSWSPVQEDERIVFEGRFDGDWEIYSTWDDGTDQLRLMDNNSNEVQPRVSPDGRWVAFASDITGNYDIWLEDPRTPSDWVQLTNDPADDLRPSWSPDSKQVAFASNRNGNWDIYAMNANGTGMVQLTDDPAEDSFPVWSPDGRQIAFYSERSGDGDIYMMDADGKNVTPLVENPGFDWSPAWSPDGQTVLFTSARDHGGTYATEIYLLDISSRELKRLTDNDGHDGIPIWSSNGRHIFFTSDRYGGTDDIWVMDADGSDARNLTEDDRSDIFGGP